MKTKREIKVGDMVWYGDERVEVTGLLSKQAEDGSDWLSIKFRSGLPFKCAASSCKLIIPRKKKAKKDRKVRVVATLKPETVAILNRLVKRHDLTFKKPSHVIDAGVELLWDRIK